MKMMLSVLGVFLVVLLVGSPVWAGEAVLLNDEELDQVYAGQNDANAEVTNGNNNVANQNIFSCTGVCNPNFGGQIATSAINVQAFGSMVNAQLNIVVNSDGGTIGTLNQAAVGMTSTGGGNIN